MSIELSIIIVSWNTRTLIAQCLKSIFEHPIRSDFEIIVVDNASTDGSQEMLREQFPTVELISRQDNLGYGAANNLAARHARGKFTLLLNPDTIIHAGTLQELLDYIKHRPQVGAVGPRLLNADGSFQLSLHPKPTLIREAWRMFHLDRLYPLSQYSQRVLSAPGPQVVDVLKGACILLQQGVVDKIGLFDEQFFMYSEEVDLCVRIQKAGWEVQWLPGVSITHFGGESTKLIPEEMFLELYKNKTLYFRKHFGSPTVQAYKALLFVIALTRWLPGTVLKYFPNGKHAEWERLARQYSRLMSVCMQY